jgi:hypothetical protein
MTKLKNSKIGSVFFIHLRVRVVSSHSIRTFLHHHSFDPSSPPGYWIDLLSCPQNTTAQGSSLFITPNDHDDKIWPWHPQVHLQQLSSAPIDPWQSLLIGYRKSNDRALETNCGRDSDETPTKHLPKKLPNLSTRRGRKLHFCELSPLRQGQAITTIRVALHDGCTAHQVKKIREYRQLVVRRGWWYQILMGTI